MLLFFFDGRFYEDADISNNQSGSETIIYFGGDVTTLQRAADFPESLESYQRFRTCSIRFERDWMVPNSWNSAARILKQDVFHFVKAFNVEVPSLVKIYEELVDSLIPYPDNDKHHLLGYAEPVIQEDPIHLRSTIDSSEETLEALLSEWILLLQISSDDLPSMLWGDTSSLYYTIYKQDLLARQFDKASCIVEFC